MSKPIYFKSLNALRFFAATAVIFHHVEQAKHWFGIPTLWGDHSWKGAVVDALGHKAVSFFFVLSGFLISYLLFAEMKRKGRVQLGKFYLRRVLRIWPLYYVIVLTAIFVLPLLIGHAGFGSVGSGEGFFGILLLHLLFLPNLMRASPWVLPGANQAWSVGVEEQFYLIWPWLISRFRNRIPQFLVGFIALKLLLQLIMSAGLAYGLVPDWGMGLLAKVYTVFKLFQVEQMAVGGLVAWLLFTHQEGWLRWLYHPAAIVLSLGLVSWLVLGEPSFDGYTVLEALAFSVLILNASTHPKMPNWLEGPRFSFLGNISYGIYMWHTMVILIVLSLLSYWLSPLVNPVWFNVLLYSLSIAITLVLSSLSYRYLEQPFLRLKERFTVVLSGRPA